MWLLPLSHSDDLLQSQCHLWQASPRLRLIPHSTLYQKYPEIAESRRRDTLPSALFGLSSKGIKQNYHTTTSIDLLKLILIRNKNVTLPPNDM